MRLSRQLTFLFLPAVRRCGGQLALVGWLFLGAGCARPTPAQQTAAANVPGAAAVRFLGNVHVIGTSGRFVLVEASAAAVAASLTDGQALVCRAAGADTATLRVSRERRPPFVVADVASGEPRVGDEVFVPPVPEPAAKPVPPVPASIPAAAPASAPLFRTEPAPPAS